MLIPHSIDYLSLMVCFYFSCGNSSNCFGSSLSVTSPHTFQNQLRDPVLRYDNVSPSWLVGTWPVCSLCQPQELPSGGSFSSLEDSVQDRADLPGEASEALLPSQVPPLRHCDHNVLLLTQWDHMGLSRCPSPPCSSETHQSLSCTPYQPMSGHRCFTYVFSFLAD